MTKVKGIIFPVSLVLIFLFSSNVKAQTNQSDNVLFNVGVEAGFPVGNMKSSSDFMLGGTASLQYKVNQSLALTLTSGYYNFFAKAGTLNYSAYGVSSTLAYESPNTGIIPVKAGVKVFFADNIYFGAEGGVGFDVSGGSGNFAIVSPALGYGDKSWDVSVRYEDFFNHTSGGFLGLRVARNF